MLRHVRRLHFTCAREDDARHARVLLEDALRTATLGDEGRLIVIRRLHLGRVPARASATLWSRRLEESFRAATLRPLRFDEPGAGESAAVYFPSRDEPWLGLAVRVATRGRCDEWFWPAALDGWRPTAEPGATLRQCLRILAGRGGLSLTLLLAARLRQHGALGPLLAALQREDVAGVDAAIRIDRTAVAVQSVPTAPPPAIEAAEAGWIANWGSDDVRTRWLAAAHVTRALPPHAFPPSVSLPLEFLRTLEAASTSPARSSPRGGVSVRSAQLTRLAETAGRHSSVAPAAEADRFFTHGGGLFFVLPLLVRAGLPAHLEPLHPDAASGLPWQILQLVLRHARVREDDQLVVALRDFSPADEPLGRWLLAANRQARRLAGLSLRQLVLRPALVAFTATDVDVFFRRGEADVRIRRAGLDIDPGWVPWLGRTVAFHYDREA